VLNWQIVVNVIFYRFASVVSHIDFRFCKISANQRKDTKILFSDWLFQFLEEIFKFIWKMENETFLQNHENLVILGKSHF
jgi:hypothetical protein